VENIKNNKNRRKNLMQAIKKKIFTKATFLFLAFALMLTPFNFGVVSAEYDYYTADMSVFEVVDEWYAIEETALTSNDIIGGEWNLIESTVLVEELIMTATSSSSNPPGIWDDEFADMTMSQVASYYGWQVYQSSAGGAGYIMGYVVGGSLVQIGRYDVQLHNGVYFYHFHINHLEWNWFNSGRGNVHWRVKGW